MVRPFYVAGHKRLITAIPNPRWDHFAIVLLRTPVYRRPMSLLQLLGQGHRPCYWLWTSSPLTRYLEDVGMRYYQEEHESAYRKIEQLGYTQWNDLFDQRNAWTYDHFQNRPFLDRVIPQLELPEAFATSVLEYGCGTGPAACYLAAHGFQVDAIDLIPEAITIAKRMADDRALRVSFGVADMTAMASESVTRQYDLVLDSFCLQSIVTDEDRRAVFAAVQARLKPNGYYLISTALYDSARIYGPDSHYDAVSGICYTEVADASTVDQAVEIDGRLLIPHRRHLTADALRAELVSAGFHVLNLETSDSGEVVCCRDTSRGKVTIGSSS